MVMTPWNSARACLYGAAIGAVAAAFKLLAPLNATGNALASKPHTPLAIAEEILGAALAFALLSITVTRYSFPDLSAGCHAG